MKSLHIISTNLFLFLVILSLVFQIPFSSAQVSPAIISDFVIKDPNGNDVTDQNLLAGGVYEISFSITVGASLNDRMLLTTDLHEYGDRYWTLENNYGGVDTESWQPGANTVSFSAQEGIGFFTLEGKIPDYYTEQLDEETGRIVHTLTDLNILIISIDSTRDVVDNRVYTITDQTIIEYQNLKNSKELLLSENSIHPKYYELALSVISESDRLTAIGYYDDAISLLHTIPDSDFPSPPERANLFLATSAVFAVLSIILAVFAYRGKMNSDFTKNEIDEESKKIDLLLVKVNRIDSALADELENIKKALDDL